MPHYSETKRKALPGTSRPARRAGTDGKNQSTLQQDSPYPDLKSMQQAYGNYAVERMVLAARAEHRASRSEDGMKALYAETAARMEAAALREGRSDVLEPFAGLTPAQKMSVMRAMRQAEEGKRQSGGAIDWERLMSSIRAVQGVSLEADEIEREAFVEQPGAAMTEGAAADLTGLLAPYRDIARWLHYKADKQGKPDLMRLFRALSIPQQQIALHRMADKRKLDIRAFAEAMTVTIDLEEWVDWHAFAAAVRAAGEIQVEAGADPLDYVAVGDEAGKEEEAADDGKEEDSDGGFGIAGLLGAAALLGLDGDADEREQGGGPEAGSAAGSLRARMTGPGRLGWLLLGVAAGIGDAAALRAFVKRRAAREAVVDRFLGLPAGQAGKARAELRGRLLRRQGFAGVAQCYAALLAEVASIVAERAAEGADPAYAKLLGDLGLTTASGRMPTPDMVLKKLTATG